MGDDGSGVDVIDGDEEAEGVDEGADEGACDEFDTCPP